MTTKDKPQRPVFFKLTQISMPVGSITPILHRVTGVLAMLASGLAGLALWMVPILVFSQHGAADDARTDHA